MDQGLRELTLTGILMTAVEQLPLIETLGPGYTSYTVYSHTHEVLREMAGMLCNLWGHAEGGFDDAEDVRLQKLLDAIAALGLRDEERALFTTGVWQPGGGYSTEKALEKRGDALELQIKSAMKIKIDEATLVQAIQKAIDDTAQAEQGIHQAQ